MTSTSKYITTTTIIHPLPSAARFFQPQPFRGMPPHPDLFFFLRRKRRKSTTKMTDSAGSASLDLTGM
jgi:hypothetical protein